MKESTRRRIERLTQNPYIQGFGSIADIYGPQTKKASGTLANDVEALRRDWKTIGNDMRTAMTTYLKNASSYGK